ncbi:MAG: MFS transporter [Candidatus Latescibacteria bacterium]|nr:MFS transporter [Candidatus Latescibacterota bacterium]NIM64449.1 MFS transporter [Candidatus Latescibacterota bacterium]NIO00602.1 MFS transporter [Candidatus Latescibacterota bacterium]NIO27003.1 MFS transporter [Candidatus Latescibacterota bacterium]NIO56080.1 MFS transporter [Candidatus Latescibacterota bacterium]
MDPQGDSQQKFPKTFWVANVMEIFERMAWYGFFSVSSLYITNPRSEGALGFTSEQRGTLQGVITFILYMLPVLSGALADRYGYKKMFIVAYAILTPAYFLLGQAHSYIGFFFVFLFVAVGAAIFKPVVVGTVARTTTEKTSSMGFGIFYMMVNIGGFLGPIVAGIVRGWSWKWVFVMSSLWIAMNFIWVTLLYKEPTTEARSETARTFKKVIRDMVEVLGNWRLFSAVLVVFVFLVCGTNGWVTWRLTGYILAVWVGWNLLYDLILWFTKTGGRSWLLSPMRIGNWRFVLFLVILSGFWTAFNQIFMTMPEYIRDFVHTRDILLSLQGASGNLLWLTWPRASTVSFVLVLVVLIAASLTRGTRAPKPIMISGLSVLAVLLLCAGLGNIYERLQGAIASGYEVNPEYIINIDAGAIIAFQVLVSFTMKRFQPFVTMVVGTIVAGIGIALAGWAITGWFIIGTIVIFAFGEMAASPKSQEYIGRVAPQDKVALFMGYYFVAIALGNLSGGLLSGICYQRIALDLNRPDIMWWIFGVISFGTAAALLVYNKYVVPGWKREVAAQNASAP